MFVSHHHSVVHHTSGSHPSTYQDPKKEAAQTLNKTFADLRPSLNHSNKFVLQHSGNTRGGGTGKFATTTTPNNPNLAQSRSFGNHHLSDSAPTAASQAWFGNQQQQSAFNRSAFAATGNPTVAAATTGVPISKSNPVKFLFKKPPLPATISSSSALYHFSTSASSNSLSKFAIPKLNNNNNASAVPNGDQSSLSGGGKSAASVPPSSLLDQHQSATSRVSFTSTSGHRQAAVHSVPHQQQPQFSFTKHQHYGAQSKSKSTAKSSAISLNGNNKEANLFGNPQNEFKPSKASLLGSGLATSTSASASSARNISQQVSQVSAKSEQHPKQSKVFSSSASSQQANNNRPTPGGSFAAGLGKTDRPSPFLKERKEIKESKESTKERLVLSASQAKKDSVSVKSAKSSSSRADPFSKKPLSDKKKSKVSKSSEHDELQDLFVAKDESAKKSSKSKKESRDHGGGGSSRSHASSAKAKVDDDESNGAKSHKSKSKDNKEKSSSSKKDRKRRKMDHSSSDESEQSDLSDDDAAPQQPQHDLFAKPKAKRRRHNSDSSSSSLVGAMGGSDSLKSSPDEASYLYHHQAMGKGAQDPAAKLYSSKDTHHPAMTVAERTKQKLLADSVGGHFPSLLHNSKMNSQSPIFAAASTMHHSPNLASPPLSDSPSPPQKLISSKIPHLHEDSNGSSNGGSSGGGGLISRKENANSMKKSKSSKDLTLNNSTSGTETSHTLQTKIKYRSDHGAVTTIEIKSINKEKTWENEFKRLKSSKESSSKSTSSSSKVVGPSQSNSRHDGSNLQESSKLSESNLSLSSTDSGPISSGKKAKKPSSTKKHAQQEDGGGGGKSKKSSKSTNAEESVKKRKKRDRSPSPADKKMPPPPVYPLPTHSKYSSAVPSSDSLYSDSALAVVNSKASSLGSKPDHRHRSKSPALSSCSSSSEMAPYQPTVARVKGAKKQSDLYSQLNARGQLEKSMAPHSRHQQHSHHQRHQRKDHLHHDSDCDNDDDDDDKMSTVSAASSVSSASSRSSSSSAMSMSSASSLSSVDEKGQHAKMGNKKSISKEYSKKDNQSSKSSMMLSNSAKKERHSKSKVEITEEPFEYAKRPYEHASAESGKARKAPKSKKSLLSSDDSASESDSDSGASHLHSDHHHRSDHSDDEDHKTEIHSKPPAHRHSSDSEDFEDELRFAHTKNNVSPYKISPNNMKKDISKIRAEEEKRLRKAKLEESLFEAPRVKKGGSKSSHTSQHSLLAPPELKPSMSPLFGKSARSVATNQGQKYSPTKRGTSGGFTGLSDSDSSMDDDDEDDQHDHRRKADVDRVDEFANNKRKASSSPKMLPKSRPGASNNRNRFPDSDLSASSSSSESESEDEEMSGRRSNNSRSSLQLGTNQSTPSPQTTPNSRLPASNIYSRTNPPLMSSPFERLYQNIGYSTTTTSTVVESRNTSLSPPLRHSSSSSTTSSSTQVIVSSFSFRELQELQGKIGQLADDDQMQRIIDLIEERNRHCFIIEDNNIRFDLLKLDTTTIIEIQRLVAMD